MAALASAKAAFAALNAADRAAFAAHVNAQLDPEEGRTIVLRGEEGKKAFYN